MRPTAPTPPNDDHTSLTWPIYSFTINHTFKSLSPASVLLDRATSEFGIFYPLAAGTAVMAQHPDDEPVYFSVSSTRAACSRPGQTCKKVCVLVHEVQLDLEFGTADAAANFLHTLGRLATKVGNMGFEVFEAQSLSALNRADFSMAKSCGEVVAPWTSGESERFEWADVYATGKCADFTVVAGDRAFRVHRVLLCMRSQYFSAVCDGRFAETEQKSISLPESEETVSTMLKELYGVYNPTTGSIFTNFARRRDIEKESVMKNLLALFIACDKYNLQPTKLRAANALIDRLPFVHDALTIIHIAACIHDDTCPPSDCGLRKAIISQVQTRLPTIMSDEAAWEAYAGNKTVLKALHESQCAAMEEGVEEVLTPPVSPRGEKRMRT